MGGENLFEEQKPTGSSCIGLPSWNHLLKPLKRPERPERLALGAADEGGSHREGLGGMFRTVSSPGRKPSLVCAGGAAHALHLVPLCRAEQDVWIPLGGTQVTARGMQIERAGSGHARGIHPPPPPGAQRPPLLRMFTTNTDV